MGAGLSHAEQTETYFEFISVQTSHCQSLFALLLVGVYFSIGKSLYLLKIN